jgi:hypothetical protein
MANVYAVKSGNWSDTTVWNTGSLPTIFDDVYANNFTVYINTDPTVISIRTMAAVGINAGGVFVANDGITLRSNVIGGTTTCLQFISAAPSSFTLVGNLSTNNPTGANNRSFLNNSTGTVFISGNVLGCTYNNSNVGGVGIVDNRSTGNIFLTGNITGYFGLECASVVNFGNGNITIYGNLSSGTGNNANFVVNNGTSSSTGAGTGNVVVYGDVYSTGAVANIINRCTGSVTVYGNFSGPGVGGNNTHNGVFNIIGNITGGSVSNRACFTNSSTGVVNITGNIVAGSGNDVYGINNTSLGTINVYGNVTGGTGATSRGGFNGSVGTINVYGSVTGGTNTNTEGLLNNSTGIVYAQKVIGNGFGLGSVGIISTIGLVNSQNGRAYVEQVEFGPRGQTPISGPVYILPSNRNTLTGVLTALGNTITFYNSLSVDGLLPPASSVQLGTVYNVGNSVGTMAVPPPSAVEFGVSVDNTVGVAALTPQTVWGYSRLSATDVGSMGDRLRNAATAQSVGSQIASFNL